MSDTVQQQQAASVMDQAFLTGDPDAGELILVRHGEQDFPPAGTRDFSRYVDPPLSARGRRQADAVGTALSGRPVAAVYSSGLERARDTGAAIAAHHGVGVTVIDDLREVEIFRDVTDGKSPADVFGAEAMVAARDAFVATGRWEAYPGSETGGQLRTRVVAAVESILDAHPGDVVVVACHGGVINAYVTHVLGIEGIDMFFRPAHASTHRMAYKDGRRVVGSLNEVHHLDPVEDLLSW